MTRWREAVVVVWLAVGLGACGGGGKLTKIDPARADGGGGDARTDAGCPFSCDDANPCTTDSCDPVLGCRNVALSDGTSCDDGNQCNGTEACQMGVCRRGSPKACNDGNPCTRDSCDPAEGCDNSPLAEGVVCGPGSKCGGPSTCAAGVCMAGPKNCDDGNPCTAEVCTEAGGCVSTMAADGTGCGDGKKCTAGKCGAPVASGCVPADCNDGNPCTTDTCEAGTCKRTPKTNGADCNDGDVCNGAETCQNGTCGKGTPMTCVNSNPCGEAVCDKMKGCMTPSKADGTSCGAADMCGGAKTCQTGQCKAAAGAAKNCDDSNSCTTDTCDGATGCKSTAVADNTACANGKCLAGKCVPATSGCTGNCDDNNPCTKDSCDTAMGKCVNTPGTEGTACDDADLCNGRETCQGGTCKAGVALKCDDTNACTTDSCDKASGCKNAASGEGTACDSSKICGGKGTCQAGTCSPAAGTKDCDDKNPCTADTCDASGACKSTPVTDGTACADADRCNGDEKCQAGVCAAGTKLTCDDQKACTDDVCDPLTGCKTTNKADGATCEDGNMCTDGDKCAAGVCTGAAKACAPENGCQTAGTCEPATGKCVNPPKVCLADSGCTAGTCNPATGVCAAQTCPPGTGGACPVASSGLLAPAESAGGLAVDAAGNRYLVGEFGDPINFGNGEMVTKGGFDIYIVSLDSSNTVRWSKSFGDGENQSATAAVIDGSNQLIVIGKLTGSIDFSPTITLSATSPDTAFIAALNKDTGAALWAKAINLNSGSVPGGLTAIAVDTRAGDQAVVVSGSHGGGTADVFGCGMLPRPGTASGRDIVVARLDTAPAAGPACKWQKRFGLTAANTPANQEGGALAVDGAGDVYLVGAYRDAAFSFGATAGAQPDLPAPAAGSQNAFLARLAASTGDAVWAKGFAGPGGTSQSVRAVAVDSGGQNVAFAGSVKGTVDFAGKSAASASDSFDVLVGVLDGQGQGKWARAIGNQLDDQSAHALSISGSSLLVGGEFQGVLNFGGSDLTSKGEFDAFLAKLSLADGSHQCSKSGGDGKNQSIFQLVGSGTDLYYRGSIQGTLEDLGMPITAPPVVTPSVATGFRAVFQKLAP